MINLKKNAVNSFLNEFYNNTLSSQAPIHIFKLYKSPQKYIALEEIYYSAIILSNFPFIDFTSSIGESFICVPILPPLI